MKRIISLTLTICVALSALALITLPPLFAAARDAATETDATETDATPTDGQPINSYWDAVPGDGPVFPTVPLPVKGDLDGSGTLDPADARLALRYAVGLEPMLEAQNALWLVDRDGDGKATPADARLILRAAVGLDGFHLPDPSWDVYRIRVHGLDLEYGDLGALKALELNAESVTDHFGGHLPLWRVDSMETLEQWIGAFRQEDDEEVLISDWEILLKTVDANVLAFLKRYDKDFFAENDLLICYKSEGSGGYLQAVYRPAAQDGALTLTVCTSYSPEYGYTADIGMWLIFVPVSKDLTAQYSSFACRRGDTVLLDEWPDVATEGLINEWAYHYQQIVTEDAEITIDKGDNNPYVFSLKNRQDGGYIWTFDKAEGLTVQEQIVEYPNRSAVGADSLQVYAVTGNKPGTYTLRFRLKRSWETDSIAERTVTVIVK